MTGHRKSLVLFSISIGLGLIAIITAGMTGTGNVSSWQPTPAPTDDPFTETPPVEECLNRVVCRGGGCVSPVFKPWRACDGNPVSGWSFIDDGAVIHRGFAVPSNNVCKDKEGNDVSNGYQVIYAVQTGVTMKWKAVCVQKPVDISFSTHISP